MVRGGGLSGGLDFGRSKGSGWRFVCVGVWEVANVIGGFLPLAAANWALAGRFWEGLSTWGSIMGGFELLPLRIERLASRLWKGWATGGSSLAEFFLSLHGFEHLRSA